MKNFHANIIRIGLLLLAVTYIMPGAAENIVFNTTRTQATYQGLEYTRTSKDQTWVLSGKLSLNIISPATLDNVKYAYWDNMPVMSMKDGLFERCPYLKTIAVPRYVTVIGKHTFKECAALISVTLPDSIFTVGEMAFAYSPQLSSPFVFPYLKELGNNAFRACSSLESVEFSNNLTKIGIGAFLGCTSLTSVVVGSGLKTIPEYTFQGCAALNNFSIPNSVTAIRDYAFAGSGLERIVLPLNLSSLKENAFQNCTNLASAVFLNKKVTIIIRDYVFDGCTKLTELILPPTLAGIKNCSFRNCSSLPQLEIPDKVLAIGDSAFEGCSKLAKVSIPQSVTAIGECAFKGCSELDSVYSSIEVPFKLEKDVFAGISPACVLTVPYGKRQAYINAGWTEAVFKGGVREMPAPAGISPVTAGKASGVYYDLQGKRVARPRPGAIYIKDGRKVRMR